MGGPCCALPGQHGSDVAAPQLQSQGGQGVPLLLLVAHARHGALQHLHLGTQGLVLRRHLPAGSTAQGFWGISEYGQSVPSGKAAVQIAS